MSDLENQVIEDFGDQWTQNTENEGYYASVELLKDILGPLYSVEELTEKTVVDLGAGTGRITNMLLDCGVSKVVAVEPSRAFEVLQQNTSHRADQIVAINAKGDEWSHGGVDLIVSFGVLHHIPDPEPAVKNCYANLRAGGEIVIWLYGKEGNEIYLSLVTPLRKITPHIPDWILKLMCWTLVWPLSAYVLLCRLAQPLFKLPLSDYMIGHLGKLSLENRVLTISDQLNPSYAKYYSRDEAEALLGKAGFNDVRSYHRHGYSWTVAGVKS